MQENFDKKSQKNPVWNCATLGAVSVTEANYRSWSNLHSGLGKKSKQNWVRWPVPWLW